VPIYFGCQAVPKPASHPSYQYDYFDAGTVGGMHHNAIATAAITTTAAAVFGGRGADLRI
jgi:hypothetical protein